MRIAGCEDEVPALTGAGPGRTVRCLRWEETPAVTVRRRDLQEAEDDTGVAPLLHVESLRATFGHRDSEVVAAADVTFAMDMGQCLALVGESGSGKTTIARCIVGLHRPAGGKLSFDGRLLEPLARQRSKEERRRIQIVFQNPYESLNPRHTVEETIKSAALFFRRIGRGEARREVNDLLSKVRLPERIARRYPAELSGGERQRVAIARALAAQPDLLVCDEVTSALDVSVQAAVLELLNELRSDLGLTLLFITHDLGVVASVADRVLVLQEGAVRERGSTAAILTAPGHDYTRRLPSSAPSLSRTGSSNVASATTRN
jgi:peptide/nickel transport system ATP-binding protein